MSEEKFDVEALMVCLEEAEARADSIQGLFELATEHYNEMKPRAEERGGRWAIEAAVALVAKGRASEISNIDPIQVCCEGRARQELEL